MTGRASYGRTAPGAPASAAWRRRSPRSADFALDKPAGRPCPHLPTTSGAASTRGCPSAGFRGCTVYDCFGAGQRLTQETFAGPDWRARAGRSSRSSRSSGRCTSCSGTSPPRSTCRPPHAVHDELRAAFAETDELAGAAPVELARLDVDGAPGPASTCCCSGRASSPAPASPDAGSCGARFWSARICAVRTCAAPTCGARCSSARTCAARTWAWPTSPGRTCAAPWSTDRACGTRCSSRRPSSPRWDLLTLSQRGAQGLGEAVGSLGPDDVDAGPVRARLR